VSGFMNMGNQIGAAITATLTPWIAARFGWTTSFLVAAGLCVVGAASWLVVDPTRRLRVLPVDAAGVQVQGPKHISDQTISGSPAARVRS
ncbi:MAG: MFS transporter, partial [Candidatus Sulfotelmatobacter sp.]